MESSRRLTTWMRSKACCTSTASRLRSIQQRERSCLNRELDEELVNTPNSNRGTFIPLHPVHRGARTVRRLKGFYSCVLCRLLHRVLACQKMLQTVYIVVLPLSLCIPRLL